jgi:triosephosphate isomerase
MHNLIVANWKMNPASLEEAKNIFEGIKNEIEGTNSEVVICPPFIYLAELKGLTLGAQNIFFKESGAFTGGISGIMLKDLGVEYVIIGHSESRRYLKETDDIVNIKIKEALEAGLKIIFCIGETAEEKNNGKTEEILERQIKKGLEGIKNLENINIAYEPVWAISDGDPYKTKELPTPEIVGKMHSYIRSLLTNIYNQALSENVRIIYGGSANAKNAKDYLDNAKVQGFLVGGASLDAKEFVKIVKSADFA